MSQTLADVLNDPEAMANLTDEEFGKLAAADLGAVGASHNFVSETTEPKPEDKPADASKGDTPVTPPDDKKGNDAEADGVLTKDGKHVIPFDVLKSARDRAAELERIAAEQAAEIERLKTPGKAPAGETAAPVTLLSEEDLATLGEEFPAIASAFRAAQSTIQSLTAKVGELDAEREQSTQATQQQAAAETAQSVQDAIDANAKLALLQTKPKAWEMAVQIDKELREQPEWQGKTYAERFAEVTKRYEAEYGVIPVEAKAAPETPAAKPAAPAKPKGPASLSDFPGGAPTAVDEIGAIEQAAATDLAASMHNMSNQQLNAYLARLG